MQKIIAILPILLLLVTTPVLAQEEVDENTPTTTSTQILDSKKPVIKDKIMERNETAMEKKENFKEKIMQKREGAIKANQERKDTFRTKLETITDEQKKTLLERIDTKITTLNTNRTTRATENITKLENVLARITELQTTLDSQGVNTASLTASITQAEEAISEAKLAIETQAGKEYIIQITTETALKSSVGTLLRTLNQDLTAMYKSVMTAKQEVINAAQEAKNLNSTQEESPVEEGVAN